MLRKLVCVWLVLIVCLCSVSTGAGEPAAVLPAFQLVDSAGNPVAPVVGANIYSTVGAVLLVRFREPVHQKSLLFSAVAGGQGSSRHGGGHPNAGGMPGGQKTGMSSEHHQTGA